MRYADRTALVTGASSGMGQQFARDLARRGSDLVLVARRTERLEELAHQLREAHGVAVTSLAADLSEPSPGLALRAQLADRGLRVATLVNCAGVGVNDLFAEADVQEQQRQIAVNVAALVGLTHAFLPDLLHAGDGALVNVASVVGTMPAPRMAVYGASKAFVISFTTALHHELRGSGVTVLALVPGSTRTEFFTTSNTSENGVPFQTPEQVVTSALAALDSPRPPSRRVSGRLNAVVAQLPRVLPLRAQTAIMARFNAPSEETPPSL